MTIQTNSLFPSCFNNDFKAVLDHQYTEFTEYGGRGSCKSSFVSICIIILLVSHPTANALILRKYAKSLRNSVYEQIRWAIRTLNLSSKFKCTESLLKITYIPTGQVILFSGVDDPTRLKSLKVQSGYFAITWFEESCEFSLVETENVKLTTMRGGDKFWIFNSFNPPASARNWINADIRTKKENRLVHLSDYRTTPIKWLGEAFVYEAEQMAKTNERAYRNIFLGEATGTGSNIFENIQVREIKKEELNSFEWFYHGIDWGYFPDPFMFGSMSYNAKEKTLYIFDELKLLKHGNLAASKKLKEHFDSKYGVDKWNYNDYPITADSAEPKSVADFKEWGWNIRESIKGPGSLESGFKWLQSLKSIVIDPGLCPNACDEFCLYEHEIDRKTGEVLSGYPQGQPDHFLALTRYALEGVWRRRGS